MFVKIWRQKYQDLGTQTKNLRSPACLADLKVKRRQPAGQTLPMKKPLEQGILPRHWVAGEILGTLHTCQNMTKPNGSNLKQLSETVFLTKKPDWQLSVEPTSASANFSRE